MIVTGGVEGMWFLRVPSTKYKVPSRDSGNRDEKGEVRDETSSYRYRRLNRFDAEE